MDIKEEILENFREYVKKESEKIDPDGRLYLNPHLIDTEKQLLKLKPDADIGTKIAALGHDIERVFPKRVKRGDFPSYNAYKMAHAVECAKKTNEFLTKYNIDDKAWFSYISDMIIYHDIEKGYPEKADEITREGVDLVRDSDSISFFHVNTANYFKDHDKDDFREKIIFMYEKISDQRKAAIDMFLKGRESEDEMFKIALEIINKKKLINASQAQS